MPQDFDEVLFSDSDNEVPGGMVGSSVSLLRECDKLAEVLGIPVYLDKDTDELWDAADSQGDGDLLWQKYGIETFSCVALRDACRRSIDTGAAVVFCENTNYYACITI